jgi:2-dehydropantoate 2-reductase
MIATVRFVVYGAGAIGGVLGGRLFQHGHDVVLVARGAHLDAIRAHGLTLESPDDRVTLDVDAVGAPAEIAFRPDDVVVLCMKSQDTVPALDALVATAPSSIPVVCAQNGVENERAALRRFERVYGMCVICPATHLDPGIVQASSSPVTGIMDLGRWPSGLDAIAVEIAAALSASTFASEPREDIARWKWGKLLMNLGNAVEAVFHRDARAGELAAAARREGVECLRAAGVDFVPPDEDAARRGELLTSRPIGDRPRSGGSTWQSMTRSAGVVETDFLTGEIVLLGRLAGFPTPVNAWLQDVANVAARSHAAPGSRSADEAFAALTITAPAVD